MTRWVGRRSDAVAAARARAGKAKLPRCGAKTKGDGSPCKNPGVGAGGRCFSHGGATPRGAQWHRPQFPKNDARYRRKLIALAKRKAKLEARIAAMTPEERAKYEKYSAWNRPGSPSERETRRRNREAMKLIARREQTPDPELAALEAEWTAARARLEALISNQEEIDE